MLLPTTDRFWKKVDRRGERECWSWTAARNSCGYGSFWDGRAVVQASRFSWQLENGPIPAGLYVLHSCDNPPCVNPAHLFLGTQGDNVADRKAKGRRGGCLPANKTHCNHGHEFAGRNIMWRWSKVDQRDYRSCRACYRAQQNRTYHRRQAARREREATSAMQTEAGFVVGNE
jgi:hypothetical protein